MQRLLENKIVVTCLTWLVVRVMRRPLSLFLPVHFRDGSLWVTNLQRLQLVIGSSRDVVQRVLVRGAGRYPKSRVMQPLLCPLIGTGLFASEGPDVPSIRRMFIRAIAQVDDAAIAAASLRLLDAYRGRWRDEGSLARLPVSAEMSRLTVDIVSECLFRTRFTPAESAEFTLLFFRYQFEASPLRLFPWVGTRVFAPRRQARQARLAERMRALMRARFVLALRDPGSPAASSPFALAMADRERAGETALSDERLLDEVAVMLLAGHETSASALSWLLRALARDPVLQRRLRHEAARADAAGARAEQSLMRSVINEVLRLYPPIPLYARDATVADTLDDTPIRKGAVVLVPSWVIHRHERLWDDPQTFRPDRFRTLSAADTANRFLPFGAGPRGCPGSRFAMIEMQVIVDAIVRGFDLRPMAGREAQPLGNLTTRPDREIHVAFDPVTPADAATTVAAEA